MNARPDYRSDIDGLRAVAVLGVLVYHYGATWLPGGFTGVDVFFVISGFLITSILRREILAGEFSLLGFYDRRLRRIAPALFAVLLVSLVAGWFLLIPGDYADMAKSAAYSAGGLGNLYFFWNTGYFDQAADLQPMLHMWSLGVEEQFYFVWPWLLLLIPKRAVVPVLLLFFAGWSLLPLWVDHFHADIPVNEGARRAWRVFFYGAKFNSMAFGCVLGYAFAKGHGLLHRVSNKVVAYGSAFLAFGLWFSGTILPLFHDEIFTVLFGLIVLNAASGRYPAFIDRGPLDFLGRISYGIYMYHWMVLLLMMSLLDHSAGMLRYNVLLHGSVVGLTILVAWLSFIGPERYFLRLKTRFERV